MVKVRVKRLLAVLCVLVLVGIAALWGLTRMTPHWYEPPNPTDEKVLELADRVEFRLLEEFQKIRPDPEPWKLRVRENQLNAWLATKLQDWIAHKENLIWPEDLDMPQIRFEPDGISLAVAVESLGPSKIIVTRMMPRFEGGELLVTVNRFSLGRLNIPGKPVERIAGLIDEYASSAEIDDPVAFLFLRMLRGDEHIDPVLDLADSRRVRLTNLELENGSVILTAKTLAAIQP
ncbi:MAG: hypothetical protein IID30_01180 [Planctomycetes bacterium]|nr:hypothetical protein [Planctomycetota bacterium]